MTSRRGLLRRWCFVLVCALGASHRLSAQEQPSAPPAAFSVTPDPAQHPPIPDQEPLNPTQEIAGQQPEGNALDVGPAKLRIGGYLGLTGLFRSTNSGGGPGTAFATTPYPDQAQGNVSEARLTAETSRLSLRVDAEFPENFRRLSGYFEMDFSGNAPGNVAVTTSGFTFRLRHAFGEIQYRDALFLSAGQAFTLMTAVKDQLSTWPSDVELTQAVDTNYVAGAVWARLPQFRLTWRPSKRFNWAVSIENPEQQIGNGLIQLPACCAGDIELQYSTGIDQLRTPNLMPDILTRVALNPIDAIHVDVGGVFRVFRHTVAPYQDSFKQVGGGASVNADIRLTATTRLIAQSAFGSGMGRYVGGLVPDVSFGRDGSIRPIGTVSWVGGIEQRVSPRAALAGYESGVVIDHSYALDVDGRYIGYGFPGSPDSNNRWIQELTGTFSYLLTKTEHRGSVQLGIQTSWLERVPWSPGSGPLSASGARGASALLVFAQLRYNLP